MGVWRFGTGVRPVFQDRYFKEEPSHYEQKDEDHGRQYGSGIHFLRVYGCRRDLSHHAVVPHGGTCG